MPSSRFSAWRRRTCLATRMASQREEMREDLLHSITQPDEPVLSEPVPSESVHKQGPQRSGLYGRCLSRRHLTLAKELSPSFYGSPTERLVTYAPSKVPFLEQTLPGGSIGAFTDVWIWAISLACSAAAVAIMLLTPRESSKDVSDILEAIQQTSQAMSTLVAFLVGRFVHLVVTAWMARRASYSSMCNGMRNLLLVLSSCVSVSDTGGIELPASHREAVRRSRTLLGRYVLLASELAVLKPRGHLDSDRGRAHLEALELLRAGEWEAMVKGDRHTSVLGWIHAGCVDLHRRGLLETAHLEPICGAVVAARTLSNDLMSSSRRDLPLPYANLVAWLVRMAVLLQTIVVGLEMHQMDNLSSKIYAAIGVFLYAYFFHAFVGIHRVLHNPFLDRLIDVAHERTVTEGLRRLAQGLMRGTDSLPPAWLEE